jgi:hypothetical protein
MRNIPLDARRLVLHEGGGSANGTAVWLRVDGQPGQAAIWQVAWIQADARVALPTEVSS